MEQIDPLLLTTLTPLSPLSPPPTPSSTSTSTPTPPPSPQPQIQNQTTSRSAGSNTVVPVSDKKGKQIPIISTIPTMPTTSTTSNTRSRLLHHEQLRNYIEDAYIRMPLALYLIWFGERSLSENETQESVGGILEKWRYDYAEKFWILYPVGIRKN
ncbi:hypothetical protein EVAR_72585_1 [Eumeta japonica]|uniref:Uncharacterized protein n=1 Tax=Eumeta variegata TaxID=151549 RepID=A0A4C1STZ6_EUMVA|nr:hypothetical protein EVAR_72585_1 [Eumeta japonica]